MESTLEPRFPPARIWVRTWADALRAVVSALPGGASHFGAARRNNPKLVGLDAMGGAARTRPMDVAAGSCVGLGSFRGRLSGAACRGVGLLKSGTRVAGNGRIELERPARGSIRGGRVGAPAVPGPGLGRLDAGGPNRLALRRIPPGGTLGSLGTMRTIPGGPPHGLDPGRPVEKQQPKKHLQRKVPKKHLLRNLPRNLQRNALRKQGSNDCSRFGRNQRSNFCSAIFTNS